MTRKRRRVWVDGAEFGTEKEAAEAAGVSVSTVCGAVKKGGRTVKGKRILPEAPPRPPREKLMAAKLFRPRLEPLLRFPPGEGPLYEGLRRWR
jgi:hypothetical protein